MQGWRVQPDGTYVTIHWRDEVVDPVDLLEFVRAVRKAVSNTHRDARRTVAEARRLRNLAQLHRRRAQALRRIH